MDSAVWGRLISRCTEDRAQATVEAALLLPSFLIVLLLALQPVCVLYTRSIMEGAAAETARLAVTSTADDDALEAFALRRLAAVPDVSIFHAGGPLAWDVDVSRAVAGSGEVGVAVRGAVTPLPVLGVFASALGGTNSQGDVEVLVEVAYSGRPDWLEGDYDSWVSAWG